MLIEEDDIFKFNCENIQPDDFVSFQLVTSQYEIPEISKASIDDSQKRVLLQKCKENTDENGLLVLAKSDLKLSYLLENNQHTIRTYMRSEILQSLDVKSKENKVDLDKESKEHITNDEVLTPRKRKT